MASGAMPERGWAAENGFEYFDTILSTYFAFIYSVNMLLNQALDRRLCGRLSCG
jgi:hypothetical protein